MDETVTHALAESHSAEAQNAEIIAIQTREKAQRAQMKEVFAEAIEEMLSSNPTRYVDVSRVPLICQSIVGLDKKMGEIQTSLDEKYVTKEQFWPVKIVVFGAVAIMLTAILGAIILLVIPHVEIAI